jgi:hypothetical protein
MQSAGPKKLGDDLLVPGYLNNPFAVVNSLGHPAPALPIVGVAGRGISITVDCSLLQKYVSWEVIPRTANPCPQPPIANTCGGDPPSCQTLVDSSGCAPYRVSGQSCLNSVTACVPLWPLIPSPCFTPCGTNPMPPPTTTCTSCTYPTCLTFASCSGGSIICGPAGPATGLGVANCNPLAFQPVCQDGCTPIVPPQPTVQPTVNAGRANISLSVPTSFLTTQAQQLADPSIQWVAPTVCDSSVPAIIRFNQV